MSRKRHTLILLLTICTLSAFAQQEKDFNERITPSFDCVAVSPGGDLWGSQGHRGLLYHAGSLRDLWHVVDNLGKGHPDDSHYDGGGKLSHIICPDSNTVLVVGEIHNPFKHKQVRNTYWYSNDRGKTWESRVFAANKDQIRCTFCSPSGEVWIASDTLYCSADKGLSFTKLNHFPHTLSSISMNPNLRTGVAGCYDNAIYYTEDNWTTYRAIRTPDKQNLLNKDNSHSEEPRYKRCLRTLIFKEWIMVYQGDEWFRSARDRIEWERFPEGLTPQTHDLESGVLLLTDEAGDILSTTDLLHFDTVFHSQGDYPSRLRVCNGQLYGYISTAADHYFCHFSGDSCTRMGFFSDEHPISAPWRRATASWDWFDFAVEHLKDSVYSEKYPWGWEKKDILHFDSEKKQWHRAVTAPFKIQYMYPYSDGKCPDGQQVVISDGKQSYLVSEHNPTLQPFRIERPLDKFLRYPVSQVIFTPYTGGCFHFWQDSISYVRENDLFVAKNAILHNDTVELSLSFRAEALDALLRDLNLHYDTSITMGMFSFAKADYDSVMSLYKKNSSLYLFRYATLKDIYQLDDTVSHFSDSLIHYIMTSGFGDGCTTTAFFTARIINQNGDELIVSGEDASCHLGEHSFMMPVELRTDSLILSCTHIPFLRFLGELMPQKMVTRQNFTDLDVLLKCLRYLTHPKENWKTL